MKIINCCYSLEILNRLSSWIVSSEKISYPTFSNIYKANECQNL